jgi:hypothetical protein
VCNAGEQPAVESIRAQLDTFLRYPELNEALPDTFRRGYESRDLGTDGAHVVEPAACFRFSEALWYERGCQLPSSLPHHGWKPLIDFSRQARDGARDRRRFGTADARDAAVLAGALAALVPHVQQLPAVTHQPVVVKREKRRNAPGGKGRHDPGRQRCQVMDVRNLRTVGIDERFGDGRDSRVAIRLLEGSDGAERVVDPGDAIPRPSRSS